MSPLTQEQLGIRRQGIGASEVGILFGLDPFRTELDLWLEKLGKLPEKDVVRTETNGTGIVYNPQVRGDLFEGVVARLYELTHPDHTVELWGKTTINAAHPICRATPDRLVLISEGHMGKMRLLQCKTRIPRREVLAAFGEPGTDQVPLEMSAQMQWEMLATAYDENVLAVLLGFDDYREYVVRADAKIQGDMLDYVEDWWQRHIVLGKEPKIQGERAAQYLQSKFRMLSDQILEAPPEIAAALTNLAQIRKAQQSLEGQEEELQIIVKQAIGEARGIQSERGDRVIWSQSKDSQRTDWQSVAGEFRTMLESAWSSLIGEYSGSIQADTEKGKQDIQAVIDRYTKTVAGSRSFRFTPAKEG